MAIILTAKDIPTIEMLQIPKKKYPHHLFAALNAGENVEIETYQSIGNKAREKIIDAFETRKITLTNVESVTVNSSHETHLSNICRAMSDNNNHKKILSKLIEGMRGDKDKIVAIDPYGQEFVNWLALQISEDEA